jgi:hypothetical protein
LQSFYIFYRNGRFAEIRGLMRELRRENKTALLDPNRTGQRAGEGDGPATETAVKDSPYF